MRVILASTSPRRVSLLGRIFSNFEVLPPCTQELYCSRGDPDLTVKFNALRKLRYVQLLLPNEKVLIVSADTLVYTSEKELLGKPRNFSDAEKMLNLLSGKKHYVVTGLGIFYRSHNEELLHLRTVTTEVTFALLDAAMISDYITTFQPFDKAGSYGIQELPEGFIERWKGSYSNVIGLPVEALLEELQNIGAFNENFINNSIENKTC
jgi:septum formation protein